MANRFILNETSYHGKGAIKEIPGEVKARGLSKALVCSDPDLLKFGVTQKVTSELDAAGLAACPGDGTDSAKAHADYICCPAAEGAFADLCEHYLFSAASDAAGA